MANFNNQIKFSIVSLIICVLMLSAVPVKADEAGSLRDSILANITGAQVRSDTVAVSPRRSSKDTRLVIQMAIDRVSAHGGGVVRLKPGVFMVGGNIELKDNVMLYLDEEAVLRFDPDPALYPIVETSWEGTYCRNYSPMIRAYGVSNVGITGKGTVDGNAGSTFATWRPRQKEAQQRSRQMNHDGIAVAERCFGEGDWLRPQLIQFYNCGGVTIEGVKIINSPFWCVHLLRSNNIVCRGLRYDAKLVNNDGIDPESSSNILIEDISFDNGDDNIAIKSGRDDDGRDPSTPPCCNIVIRNCHFKGLHAVVLGSELSGGIRNVIIENCDAAGYCKRGIYVKSNPDRGGFVENVYVRSCRFGEVEDLFYITASYAGEGAGNDKFTRIANIHIDGLMADKVNGAAVVIQGVDEMPVNDVTFRNLVTGCPSIGISVENATGVTFDNCFIGGKAGVPSQISDKDRIFDR